MNNISIQKEFGWCAVHNLINLLRIHNESFDWAFKEERFKESFVIFEHPDFNEFIK